MFDSLIFAERLKSARNKKHLSQAELAKGVGVSAATISSYETPNGTKIPALDKAAAIAEFLEVPLDYLCGGELPNTPITDFNLETYLRGLVVVLSETTTDFGENPNTGELNISISYPAIVSFIKKSSDLLKVYRDGSLTKDLYISCIEKIISDVCKDYSFECSAVLSGGESLDLEQSLLSMFEREDWNITPGMSNFHLSESPFSNRTREVPLFVSENDIKKYS